MELEEKKKARDKVLEQLGKQFGKGTVFRYGDKPNAEVEALSTGCLGIDIASGIGGFAKGRIIELWGLEAAGKSSIALHCIAAVQAAGGSAAFIDAEHALDPAYARNIGVDMDNLFMCQPDYGEMALEVTESLVGSGTFDFIVVDSVAALVPKSEIEGEMGDSSMGVQARLMSQAMRKLTAIVSKTHTCVLFINQVRQKIGVVYGDPSTTTGGNALKFYASQRLELKRIGVLKGSDDKPFGIRVKAKFVKNKLAPPFKEAEYDIVFGQGVNFAGEVFDYAVTLGFIDKSGSWYSYNDQKLGQGRDNALATLKDQPEVMDELKSMVRKHYGLPH